MDSFGFDFSSSDFSLDLGSLGMWGGNSTPLGSSPNGGNLPFSVGTPTGVQSLGDEPFGSLPGGNDDFNFTESPKAGVTINNAGNSTGPAASGAPPSAAAATAAAGRKPADELPNPYFGGDLDSDLSDNKSAAATAAATSAAAAKIKAESKDAAAAQQRKDSTAGNATSTSTAKSAPLATATSNSSSEQGGGLSSYLMTDSTTISGANAPPTSTADSQQQRPPSGFPQQPKASSSPGAPTRNPPTSSMPSGSSAPTSTASSAPPASTNASSARPHIDGSSASPSPSGQRGGPAAHQPPQQQQQMPPGQQRYPNQAMMGAGGQPMQPPHFAGQPPYQMNPQGNPMGMAAQPPTVNGQYMQHPQFRPSTSSYDEEYMRVRAMMMQHPDLIPPPMEVLRISMSQSAPSQNMMTAGGYMPPQQRPGMMNRIGANPGYPPYGAPNPGMIMNPQAQSPMMDARMRAIQQQHQQMGGPSGRQIPQARTPNGGPVGGPETQAAWQSENDLPLRRKMIGKMYVLLAVAVITV